MTARPPSPKRTRGTAPGAWLALGLAAACLAGLPARLEAQAPCRQALAMALDVSGSVDSREYRLQLDGLAGALRHPDVAAALLSAPGVPVQLAVFEWSGEGYQRVLLDWTPITDRAALDRIAARLTATARSPAPPVTALGRALEFGLGLLDRRRACWKRTLDISGDGKNNAGPRPPVFHAAAEAAEVTVNALVIGADVPHGGDLRQVEIAELSAYFQANVIHGPDAFVEAALGFEDYEAAMVRKLRRELEGLAVSDSTAPGTDAPRLRVSRYSGSDPSSNVPGASGSR